MKIFTLVSFILLPIPAFTQSHYQVLNETQCVDKIKVNNKGDITAKVLREIHGNDDHTLILYIYESDRIIIGAPISPEKYFNENNSTSAILAANTGTSGYKAYISIDKNKSGEISSIKFKKITKHSDYSIASNPMPKNYNPTFICNK